MNKYEKTYNEISKKHPQARWFDIAVVALAVDLEEATGLKARVSGPFGLRAECPIYLNEEGEPGERKVIYITPWFDSTKGETELVLYYDTGEVKNNYAPGTLGELNGMNNVMERLPDTLEEIVALLRSY